MDEGHLYSWGIDEETETQSFDHLQEMQSLWNGSLAVALRCVTNHRGHLAGLPLPRDINNCKAGKAAARVASLVQKVGELWGAIVIADSM